MLTVSETAALLRTFDNVLILTHIRPDGDTVGCAAALCAGLRALGKTAYLLPNPELRRTEPMTARRKWQSISIPTDIFLPTTLRRRKRNLWAGAEDP